MRHSVHAHSVRPNVGEQRAGGHTELNDATVRMPHKPPLDSARIAETLGRMVGVSAGLAGVVMIAGANSLAGLGKDAFGQAAIILATVSSAVAAIQGRRFNDVPPELAAAGTLTCGALVLVPLCFVVDAPLHFTPSAGSIVALLVNAIIATALRSVIYFRLLRTIGSMGTTSVSYLKPAIAVLIGFTLMGEALTWTAMIGLLAILFGVAVINQSELLAPSWLASRFAHVPRQRTEGTFEGCR